MLRKEYLDPFHLCLEKTAKRFSPIFSKNDLKCLVMNKDEIWNMKRCVMLRTKAKHLHSAFLSSPGLGEAMVKFSNIGSLKKHKDITSEEKKQPKN